MRHDDPSGKSPNEALRLGQTAALYMWRNQKALLALLLIAVVFTFLTEHFFTFHNLMNVARQTSIYALLAAGMTLVLTLGEIDLSVGANAGFCGVVAAFLLKKVGIDVPVAFLLILCVGGFVGLLNGFLVAKIRVPFFVATLATMSVLTGASFLITRGYPISLLPKAWRLFGRGVVWGVPAPVIIMVIVFIVLQVLQSRTIFGRKIYAVGANARAARLSGINTDRIRILAYALCGVLAGLGGIVISSRLDSGDPSVGPAFLLTLIAAPILGGTKLSGGEGTMVGTLIGALVLGVINNAMSLMNLNTYWQDVARGLIVLAIVIPQIGRRRS
jgi:ribose transport system permease protein